jgi:cadmium resistance transport/sequestration family protein
MSQLVEVMIAAIASFAATNIDDILVLMILFAQVKNSNIHYKHIVIGQYLGFFAIIMASLPGFFGGLIIEKKWIGILGLLPIIIGVSRLINKQQDENEIQTVSAEVNSSPSNTPVISILTSVLSPQTYKIAAITFANGGDNIGIYVPLFASSSWFSLGIILTIFLSMMGIWCYLAYQFTYHPIIANILTNYGHQLVPFVLIGLGIFILVDSGTYQLLIPLK